MSAPIDLVVDCHAGTVTARPFTPDEAAAKSAAEQATAAAQQAHDQKTQALLNRIKAKANNDPDFNALAQMVGIIPLQ